MKFCLLTKQHTAEGCRHQKCNAGEHGIIRDTMKFNIKSIDRDNFTVDGTFSTGMEDRMGEVVDQRGWDLSEFLKNPVVLWAHNDQAPAIGQVTAIGIDEQGNLAGTIKFAVLENPEAKVIFNLYAGGYMRAFSAGFENFDYEVDQINQRLVLKQNKLYEISCVNIPANALALAKSKGLDTSALEKKIISDANDIIQKEGRVLSAKSRGYVQNAYEALGELLKADTDKDNKSISADTKSQVSTKVETPAAPGGIKKSMRDFYKGKETVQKVVRDLLKAKAELNKN